VGTVLGGRWTLERVLGVGGMAAVYAARAPDGSIAAVKLLHPEAGLRPDVRQRFLNEGLAANRVDHPGAVRVLDHATIDNDARPLVMELLEGESSPCSGTPSRSRPAADRSARSGAGRTRRRAPVASCTAISSPITCS
jgi:serine/threonine protein kinase